MTQIRQIGPNLWEGPEMLSFTPHFMRTNHAATHYPNGDKILHDVVNPGNKKIPFIFKGVGDLEDLFCGISAGGHEGYVDMRVNSVTNRTGFFHMGLFCLFVWWTFDFIVLSNAPSGFNFVSQILAYAGYGIGAAIAFIPLFRPLATPVRFHKKNQEVYVYHKKVLYRIPWNECELSIKIAQQNEGYRGLQDGYQLSLWLNPVHATNISVADGNQQYVELNMLHTMRLHSEQYGYWEYIRRYMAGDSAVYTEISKNALIPQTPLSGYYNIAESIAWLVVFPTILFVDPGFFALLTPFRHRWPKEVHEWTGEKCNWH